MVFTPVLFVVIKDFPILVIVNGFAGVCAAGFTLGLFNLILDISAPRDRPSYITLYNTFFLV